MRTYRRCPLCKKTPVSGLYGLNEYWYCPRCSFSWQKKFPASIYGEQYYQPKSTIFSKLFAPLGTFFYRLRGWYVEQKNLDLWIDVGAGDGGFLKTVQAKRKIGVEISDSGRNIMKRHGLRTLNEKEFLRRRHLGADVISFWHVLEHMENPWSYLRSAKKNLSTRGWIVIGVPNLDTFEFRMFKRRWFHLVPQHHLWFFSPRSMRIMLRQSGFVITKIDYWSIEHHLTGILQSLINMTSGSDSVLHRLIKRRENLSSISLVGILASLFWLTAGLPIVFLFWIVSAVSHKSGTLVIVARKI